jgi:hypothetical protein
MVVACKAALSRCSCCSFCMRLANGILIFIYLLSITDFVLFFLQRAKRQSQPRSTSQPPAFGAEPDAMQAQQQLSEFDDDDDLADDTDDDEENLTAAGEQDFCLCLRLLCKMMIVL